MQAAQLNCSVLSKDQVTPPAMPGVDQPCCIDHLHQKGIASSAGERRQLTCSSRCCCCTACTVYAICSPVHKEQDPCSFLYPIAYMATSRPERRCKYGCFSKHAEDSSQQTGAHQHNSLNNGPARQKLQLAEQQLTSDLRTVAASTVFFFTGESASSSSGAE